MNDFSELESDLKKLWPATPSPELTRRIESALSANSEIGTAAVIRPRKSPLQWLSLGLGLAAAAVFLLLMHANSFQHPAKQQNVAAAVFAPSRSTAAVNDVFVPAGLTQVVYHSQDEGLHFVNGATEPVRRVRSQQREILRWKNPRTGESLRVSYPSEEVRLIPTPGQ